jgi:uncharacterized membrane protein
MAKPDAVFIYVGTYPSEAGARADYGVVKDLHAAGAIGTYDAAVITKDDAGKVHVSKDEMATRHGAWGGAAVGALIGILFPPAIIGSAAVGAAVGGVGGHLWRGMSRADVKEFGEIIDAGQAALAIVGESKLAQAVDKAALKAEKHVAGQAIVQTAAAQAHRAAPLLSYDLATGRPAWRASMPTFVQAPPVPAAGRLLIQPADPGYACASTG